MKISFINVVYVQKSDIICLSQIGLNIPKGILDKVFLFDGEGDYIEFSEPEFVSYFDGLNCIIDLNNIRNMSEQDIIDMMNSVKLKKSEISQMFKLMSPQEKRDNMFFMTECELLDFKLHSLNEILWCKQRNIDMNVPDLSCSCDSNEKNKNIKKFIWRR